jgi:glutamine synthetase
MYGTNHLRLTGVHETSSINKFTWGIGDRSSSVRVPNDTFYDQKGYFEDRRPASDSDPYVVTSSLIALSLGQIDMLHNLVQHYNSQPNNIL